jgi:hypothetical protein
MYDRGRGQACAAICARARSIELGPRAVVTGDLTRAARQRREGARVTAACAQRAASPSRPRPFERFRALSLVASM